MTDSWIEAAERINFLNAANKEQRDARAAAQAHEKKNEQEREKELQLAVADATRSLADFMDQRGHAAQELLKARGGGAYVLFGVERDGGSYTSVYLHEGGLGLESGYDGLAAAYSKELQKPPSIHTATPHDAAVYFAYYGAGNKDPESVRGIVTWLTQQVDSIAA